METKSTPPATDSVEHALDGRIYTVVDAALAQHKQEVAAMLKVSQTSFQQMIVQVLQQRGLIPPPNPVEPPRASTGQRGPFTEDRPNFVPHVAPLRTHAIGE